MNLDLRTHREKSKGWWFDDRVTVPNALPKDGLIVALSRALAEPIMDAHYPHSGSGDRKIWYFNETRDREIAEIDVEGRISANPSVLRQHFWKGE